MNNHKICFIICSNDELTTRECVLYISHLIVPVGFEVQVLTVTGAKSMTAGYNEGMAQTDAKYKVYLHQDVYLVNCHFIEDILKIFTENSRIGMIGVVGNTSLAEDGGAWSDGMWRRIGKVYLDIVVQKDYSLFKNVNKPYEEVVVLDGLLIATQYDLPWRDDLFAGWDFYDCSQALEFIRNGYKVVVPYMDKPWCLHDNDVLNLDQYDKWRRVFVREYYEDYMKWNREH